MNPNQPDPNNPNPNQPPSAPTSNVQSDLSSIFTSTPPNPPSSPSTLDNNPIPSSLPSSSTPSPLGEVPNPTTPSYSSDTVTPAASNVASTPEPPPDPLTPPPAVGQNSLSPQPPLPQNEWSFPSSSAIPSSDPSQPITADQVSTSPIDQAQSLPDTNLNQPTPSWHIPLSNATSNLQPMPSPSYSTLPQPSFMTPPSSDPVAAGHPTIPPSSVSTLDLNNTASSTPPTSTPENNSAPSSFGSPITPTSATSPHLDSPASPSFPSSGQHPFSAANSSPWGAEPESATPPSYSTPPSPVAQAPSAHPPIPPKEDVVSSYNPFGTPYNSTEPNPSSTPTPLPSSSAPQTMPQPQDSAPTDLSHLISSVTEQNGNGKKDSTQKGEDTNVYTPPVTQPETLIVQPNGTTAETPNVPVEGHKGIPKWLIGVGIGLLVAVAGASAYFILGVGGFSPSNIVIPPGDQTQTLTTPPPITTPTQLPSPTGTSGGFGELGGNSQSTSQATSAADLIRQRQQQQAP